MTPKEKAVELYNKFRNENSVMTANIRAKKQALIAVDEIINCDSFFIKLEHSKAFTSYWYNVQKEIQKL